MKEILFFIFIVLQVGDVISTLYVIKHEGLELNPIMRFLIEKIGVKKAFIGSKFLIIFFLIAFYGVYDVWVFVVLIMVYAVVLYNNIILVKSFHDDR